MKLDLEDVVGVVVGILALALAFYVIWLIGG